jgi:hypothetical protein
MTRWGLSFWKPLLHMDILSPPGPRRGALFLRATDQMPPSARPDPPPPENNARHSVAPRPARKRFAPRRARQAQKSGAPGERAPAVCPANLCLIVSPHILQPKSAAARGRHPTPTLFFSVRFYSLSPPQRPAFPCLSAQPFPASAIRLAADLPLKKHCAPRHSTPFGKHCATRRPPPFGKHCVSRRPTPFEKHCDPRRSIPFGKHCAPRRSTPFGKHRAPRRPAPLENTAPSGTKQV